MERIFTDSTGTRWRVWEVHPALWERRALEERRVADAPEPVIERRVRPERRVRTRPTGVVRPGFERGWLCFDAGLHRRRLAPIPPSWETCDVDELEGYLHRAAGGAARGA